MLPESLGADIQSFRVRFLQGYSTGDVGALAPPSRCPCGRTAPRLAGILGRMGDAVKVKGMFLRGAQVEGLLLGFPEAGKFRATVTREGHVDLLAQEIEVEDPRVAGLGERIDDRRRWDQG